MPMSQQRRTPSAAGRLPWVVQLGSCMSKRRDIGRPAREDILVEARGILAGRTDR